MILIFSVNTNHESVAYRSFSPSKFEARGARKVTTGIDRFRGWTPRTTGSTGDNPPPVEAGVTLRTPRNPLVPGPVKPAGSSPAAPTMNALGVVRRHPIRGSAQGDTLGCGDISLGRRYQDGQSNTCRWTVARLTGVIIRRIETIRSVLG